jgi:microcystin-dependent protein
MTVPNIYPSYFSGEGSYEELSGSAVNPLPTGIIIMHCNIGVPAGWLSCDGSAVSKTTYANLYSLFGPNAFGTDTSTDFFLPRYNLPVIPPNIMTFAVGASGTKAVHSTGGSILHVHGNVAVSTTTSSESLVHDHDTSFGNPDHSHSNSNATTQNANDGDHNHGINGANTAGATSNTTANTGGGATVNASHTHGINAPSTNGGGGAAHNWGGCSTGNIASGTTSHNHTISSTSVTSHTHTGSHPTAATTSGGNIPPYLMVQFIIKT